MIRGVLHDSEEIFIESALDVMSRMMNHALNTGCLQSAGFRFATKT